jgi:chromosome segregation protein
MRLKSVSLKGFKSFPDRTRLEFEPGVSVVVGPNGSGKSNITDAVLWALGEQSPGAVRGSSMQDVIFAGAPGRQAAGAAEVELVLEDPDDLLGLGVAEISIVRRLDRTGDGEYRLAGARCRLVDVIELLSDTGLGKEMHSVISQGRVESLVTSKPRDRRLLIEEAAGLGKHRKRRRRAQLKLERTQLNLDRALDVEREARGHLRPLKRQAEAAELHARLERQALEARWELLGDDLRSCREGLAATEASVGSSRARREEVERELEAVAKRREAAEETLTTRSSRREELSRRCFVAEAAAEQVQERTDRARAACASIEARLASTRQVLDALGPASESESQAPALDIERARAELREAERGLEDARREAARVAGELASVDQFLRASAPPRGGEAALADGLEVEPGYELALAAALDGRLRAVVAADRHHAGRLLDGAGVEGGTVLVAGGREQAGKGAPPVDAAERLADRIRGNGDAAKIARALLADAWVVGSVEEVPEGFAGVAVTRSGRVWSPQSRELRQASAEGDDRVLAERNRREQLIRDREQISQTEIAARAALERAVQRYDEASEAHSDLRPARRRAALAIAAERDENALSAIAQVIEALTTAAEAISERRSMFEEELAADRQAGEQVAVELRECAQQEAALQSRLHSENESLTEAEVDAQRARDRASDVESELRGAAARLELEPEPAAEPLEDEQREALAHRIERLARRREQLGPVNPLAGQEYAQAVEHVEDLERQREDLETALRELEKLIRDTDREIREAFEQTFAAAATNFEDLVQRLFPGGRGRLRLVSERDAPARVLGGEDVSGDGEDIEDEKELGVEIEITPAGKAMKRLSLLSGGEKAMTALAFLFAVFLARPCPFYVLDEVEAALDDLNIDRFLELLRAYSERAQFIVVTHQKRTMEAADCLYGVSMGTDGISKVISRRLPAEAAA